jgi:hypothetical protein
MATMGVFSTDVAVAVDPMIAKGLVETSDPTLCTFATTRTLALTPRGHAHIQLEWMSSYVSAMVDVTLIHDEATYQILRTLFDKSSPSHIIREKFASYIGSLDAQYCLVPGTPRFADQKTLSDLFEKSEAGAASDTTKAET